MRAEDRSEFDPDEARPLANSWFVPVACLMQGGAFVLLFYGLVIVVSKFERTFMEFDTTLPAITQLAISLSNSMASYWYLVALLWIGGIICLIALHRSGARTAAWILHWLVTFGVILFLAWIALAVWLPFRELATKL